MDNECGSNGYHQLTQFPEPKIVYHIKFPHSSFSFPLPSHHGLLNPAEDLGKKLSVNGEFPSDQSYQKDGGNRARHGDLCNQLHKEGATDGNIKGEIWIEGREGRGQIGF